MVPSIAKDFRRVGAVVVMAVIALVLPATPSARAQVKVAREYEVKAVFLFNFAQFVEWPVTAFADANTPVIIGVLGDDPFGDALEQAVHGGTVKGRAVVIKRAPRLDELKPCHLLFVAKSEKSRSAQILRSVSGAGMLTVGETDDFTTQGGVIGFKTQQNRVQFEINVDAAEREGLKVSAKLLKVSRIVGSPSGREAP